METNGEKTGRLAGSVTVILIFFLLSRTPADADLWWHLRAGQVMWSQKSILLADVFSYTRAGASWINAFWISDLWIYVLHQVGGTFALAAFVALTGACTFYIIHRQLERKNTLPNSFILILAAMTAAPVWGPRPQILSFLLAALLDFLLNKGLNKKWILLPLFALWANLHGGWIWGFLLLAAHAAGLLLKSLQSLPEERPILRREAWSLLGWTALSIPAVGLNPNGFALWKLPFEQINVSMQIQEWLSPDFHRIDFHPFLWMIFLLLLTGALASRRPNWPQLFKVIGFAYMTFIAQRSVAVFAIVAAPLLAEWSGDALDRFRRSATLPPGRSLPPRLAGALNAAILVLLGAAALGNLSVLSQPARVEEQYPAEAVQWIKENQPEGRLFNSYNWGGYILWKLPEYPVFIDGRADLYGSDLITQWRDAVFAEENAIPILDRWDVRLVLLEPDWPIVEELKGRGWGTAYQDGKSIILQR